MGMGMLLGQDGMKTLMLRLFQVRAEPAESPRVLSEQGFLGSLSLMQFLLGLGELLMVGEPNEFPAEEGTILGGPPLEEVTMEAEVGGPMLIGFLYEVELEHLMEVVEGMQIEGEYEV